MQRCAHKVEIKNKMVHILSKYFSFVLRIEILIMLKFAPSIITSGILIRLDR